MNPIETTYAEQGLLAAVLNNPSLLDEHTDLSPDLFTDNAHRTIFETVATIHQHEGSAVLNPAIVLSTLEQFGVLGETDGNLQVEALFQAGTSTVPHVETFKRRLAEAFERRRQDALRLELKGLIEANASAAELQSKISQLHTSSTVDFQFIDSAEFASRKYEQNWLVDFVLKAEQPCIVAGPEKTLKTTILCELAVSLASGKPFFGKYETRQSRVAMVSAESGEETLQETAERVCRSKDISFASLGNWLFWAFRPPQITEPEHVASLVSFIKRNRIDVLILDPAYLMLGLGDDAKNQFVVGDVLQNLTVLQRDTGAMPVLAAHTNKNIPTGQELQLHHIAYAGFGQWARQWLLLNRREAYNREQPGSHRLYFSFGGSAGHAGSWAIDVEEGDIRDGREWHYIVRPASEAASEDAQARDDAKAERQRRKEQATYEQRRSAILRAMKRFNAAETESEIRTASGLSGTAFKPVWLDLVDEGTVEHAGRIKKGNQREYDCFCIANRNGTTGQQPDCPSAD